MRTTKRTTTNESEDNRRHTLCFLPSRFPPILGAMSSRRRPQPAHPRHAQVRLALRRQRRLLDPAPHRRRARRLPHPPRPHDPRPAEPAEVRRGAETVQHAAVQARRDRACSATVILHALNGIRLTMVDLGVGLTRQRQVFWYFAIGVGAVLFLAGAIPMFIYGILRHS